MRPANVALACRARTSPAGSSGGPTTGRSEPYTSRSAPTAAAIASTAPRPVGGDVVEREEVVCHLRPAARGQPLGVERRAAGEHRPDDREQRVLVAPPRHPRVPGLVQLGDVRGERRPPAGERGARPRHRPPRRRPGMHEQRGAVALHPLEQRPDAVEAARGGEGAGGHRDPGRARGEQPVHRVGLRAVERHRAPPPERRPERLRALVVGVEERLGFAGGERFDAERARRARSARRRARPRARAARGARGRGRWGGSVTAARRPAAAPSRRGPGRVEEDAAAPRAPREGALARGADEHRSPSRDRI